MAGVGGGLGGAGAVDVGSDVWLDEPPPQPVRMRLAVRRPYINSLMMPPHLWWLAIVHAPCAAVHEGNYIAISLRSESIDVELSGGARRAVCAARVVAASADVHFAVGDRRHGELHRIARPIDARARAVPQLPADVGGVVCVQYRR